MGQNRVDGITVEILCTDLRDFRGIKRNAI